MQKAIIYLRVSSERQVNEGNGLDSQKIRCEQYAKLKGYEVARCFKDEAVSGANSERLGFNALLEYIDNHASGEFVVLVDDISRFARDMQVHIKLRQNLKDRKVTLESPNFKFEDNPEGTFIEHVIAAKSQLDREQNRRQVIQKQKARFEMGYWPLCYPAGLINIRHHIHGKILVPHEPRASIFKEAIERYRDGLLNTLLQVRDFINSEYKEQELRPFISINGAHRILTNPLYAGWIEYKPWGISLKKAQHEGFIDKSTYDLVQIKLNSKTRITYRKDYHLDFPLRGFVLCGSCNKPMTASWHRGRRGKRYAHYFCKQSECTVYGKTIRKVILEGNFEHFITNLSPNQDVLNLVKSILLDIWQERSILEQKNVKLRDLKIGGLEVKIKTLIERITKTTNEDLIKAYENEIQNLQKQERELKENATPILYSQQNFGTALETVFSYIKEPVKMWQSERYEDKMLLLEMFFEEKLTSDRNGNFGTPTLAPLFKLLVQLEAPNISLVEMARIELASKKTLVKNVVTRDILFLLTSGQENRKTFVQIDDSLRCRLSQ